MPNLFYPNGSSSITTPSPPPNARVRTPEQARRPCRVAGLAPGLVNLGLDLRGGAHLLGEVHVEDVYKARMNGVSGGRTARCAWRPA